MEPTNSSPLPGQPAHHTAESIAALTERLHETVHRAQLRLGQIQHQRDLAGQAARAACCTGAYVRENPWNAVCAAAGLGFIFGLMIGRR